MYLFMSYTIIKSCPKLITYLVSKTWVLMFLTFSAKFFYNNVIYVMNWISCLSVIDWLTNYGKLAQCEWCRPFNSMGVCDIESFPCSSFIIWTKESHVCFFKCQSIVIFAFISSCSFSTCCLSTWLHVMITATTLIGTLSNLKGFDTIVVVVVSFVWNMFWTFVFYRQLGALCLELEQIIQECFNGTLVELIGCAITSTTNSTTLVGTTSISNSSIFLLWQVFLEWLVLPQFE